MGSRGKKKNIRQVDHIAVEERNKVAIEAIGDTDDNISQVNNYLVVDVYCIHDAKDLEANEKLSVFVMTDIFDNLN